MVQERVVLGTWGLSGPADGKHGALGYGWIDARCAQEILSEAWQSGIRWVDTCRSYGDGAGFRHLSAWHVAQSGPRFRPVLKVGRPVIGGVPRSEISSEKLIEQAEQERRELGDAAAILIKDPPAGAFQGGRIMNLLADLADRFPALRVGLASHDLDACRSLPEAPGYLAQIELHALNHWSAGPIAERLRMRGWEVWGMQPLAYGFLGSLEKRTFEAQDWRSRLPEHTQEHLRIGARAFWTSFQTTLPGVSIAQLALAFCLRHPGLDRVVIGPRSVEQLRDLAAALELADAGIFRKALRGRI